MLFIALKVIIAAFVIAFASWLAGNDLKWQAL